MVEEIEAHILKRYELLNKQGKISKIFNKNSIIYSFKIYNKENQTNLNKNQKD